MNFRLALATKNALALIKQNLADEWIVLSFVLLAAVAEQSVIDGLLKYAGNLCSRQRLIPELRPGAVSEAELCHRLSQSIKRVLARCVKLKCLADERPTLRVRDNHLRLFVPTIADGSDHRPDTIPDFLPLSAFDVLAKVVHVILRHAEKHRQREFALSVWLEVNHAELHRFDNARINHVDDPAPVEHVAGEAIRVPGDNTRSFTVFDSLDHGIEDRATGTFGTLLFEQYINDVEIEACRHFTGLGKLIVDAPDLPFFVVGGLSSV